jgi:hypothetical protein
MCAFLHANHIDERRYGIHLISHMLVLEIVHHLLGWHQVLEAQAVHRENDVLAVQLPKVVEQVAQLHDAVVELEVQINERAVVEDQSKPGVNVHLVAYVIVLLVLVSLQGLEALCQPFVLLVHALYFYFPEVLLAYQRLLGVCELFGLDSEHLDLLEQLN